MKWRRNGMKFIAHLQLYERNAVFPDASDSEPHTGKIFREI